MYTVAAVVLQCVIFMLVLQFVQKKFLISTYADGQSTGSVFGIRLVRLRRFQRT